jgi:hypothetical protein
MRVAATVTLLLLAAGAQAGEKFPKCFDASRDGHCVAVSVNGQRTVRLAKKNKKMLEAMGALSPSGGETRYEVAQPVRGDLDVRVEWLPEAAGYFGAPPDVSTIVYPLDGQDLATRPEISSASSISVGGAAPLTVSDVIEGNRLPPGRYLLAIRVSGARTNWDRQTLLLQVAE